MYSAEFQAQPQNQHHLHLQGGRDTQGGAEVPAAPRPGGTGGVWAVSWCLLTRHWDQSHSHHRGLRVQTWAPCVHSRRGPSARVQLFPPLSGVRGPHIVQHLLANSRHSNEILCGVGGPCGHGQPRSRPLLALWWVVTKLRVSSCRPGWGWLSVAIGAVAPLLERSFR